MPCVYVNGLKVPLPDAFPVAGQLLKTVVQDRILDDDGEECWARITPTTIQLMRHWPSMVALFSTLGHEFNHGVDDHCNLGLEHWQVATLGEGAGPAWLAFVMAQDDDT